MTEIHYSRGVKATDNMPDQRVCADFISFRNAILTDVSFEKGHKWIAAPFAIAPDDELHRSGGTDGSFARAIGKPHRCSACAQPRRFIGLDIDQSLTPQSFVALVSHLQQHSGLVYATASHTAAAPRCRVILELDLPAPRAELIAATRAVQKRISAAMSTDGYDALVFDASCDKPEQPLYGVMHRMPHYLLDGRPLSLGELLADIPPIVQKPSPVPSHPVVAVVVAEGRHEDLLALCGRRARDVHRGDMIEADAWASILSERDRGRWTRAVDDAEMQRAFKAALVKLSTGEWQTPAPVIGVAGGGVAANDDAREVLRSINFTRADQIEFKSTDWLIEGWLVKDTLAGLVAPSGACKSFLAIDWSCRVATGSLWFGRNVKQGAVFYLAGEGRTGLRKRIVAWEKHNGVSIEGAPLFLADSLPFLCDDISTASVIRAIQSVVESISSETGCVPEMIVVDTVARAMSGANENSSEDMGKFIGALDALRSRWGATVLTVHHTGHDPNNQERGRGSSAYKAALDSEMVIKPGDPEFTLKATKCKDWAEPSPLTLQRVPVEIEIRQADGTSICETSLALHDAPGALSESKRRAEVIELCRQGKSQREIAEETGTPRTTVQRWLKKAA